jgi:hypothetical protein
MQNPAISHQAFLFIVSELSSKHAALAGFKPFLVTYPAGLAID